MERDDSADVWTNRTIQRRPLRLIVHPTFQRMALRFLIPVMSAAHGQLERQHAPGTEICPGRWAICLTMGELLSLGR